MNTSDLATFKNLVTGAGRSLIPMVRLLMGDSLTPVLAYRRLVQPDPRMAPSFLLESVVGGDRVGRYSYLGAQPCAQVIARGHEVQYIDSLRPNRSRQHHSRDPLREMAQITQRCRPVRIDGLPDFAGGWVGFAGYDVVRYLEGEKLLQPPPDDRKLPDLHMGLYRQIVAFDHVHKTILVITHVMPEEHGSATDAFEAGHHQLDQLVQRIETPRPPSRFSGQAHAELPVGRVDLSSPPTPLSASNMGEGGYQAAVIKAKQHIAAGDIFQVVPSQRFARMTKADPFDIYRALRIVNPSPYMYYLQIQGGMLVGSSPEILCRVHGRDVTTRPLAGTRPRGKDQAEDQRLEAQLLADPKERAEHIMLVDLGRNDVGRVSQPGSIQLPQVMAVERYSHVMHISSTVTGSLKDGYTCWDALQHTLPVGTVSGAPKVRAMQIIDDLEPTRRGPYAGAVGYVDFVGDMDMAIALRTMVITPAVAADTLVSEGFNPSGQGIDPTVTEQKQCDGHAECGHDGSYSWRVDIQVGAGIVADSDPDAEHQETLSKAAALTKAVDLAETAFAREIAPDKS